MAFVFQADRKGIVSPSNLINPGPGQYTPQSSQSAQGYAPFLSTVERGIDKKKKDTLPGPGSYESFLAIGSTMKPNKTFHATLSPDKGQVDFTNQSTAFKSKTKRFEYKIDSEQPGPGKYYKDPGFGKPLNVVSSAVSLHLKTCAEVARGRALPEDRTVIPSIPSYSHHYGYTEVEGNKLMLNKNPLLEIQQFVGPGYYDTKDMVQVNPNRGTIWHKSSTKRFESHSSNVKSRMHIGPGTYEIPNLDGAQPKYKVKPSSSFASTTMRNFIGKGKPKEGTKGLSKTVDQFAIEFDTENLTSVIVERKDEDDKHEDDAIPGPGSYHNEVWSSSLKTRYKPSHLQFFGSTEDRFKNEVIASQGLGPGEYNHMGEALKKIVHPLLPTDANKKLKDKPGFRSTDLRFKDVKNPTLGPGVYEPKTTIIDKVKDMARKGYLGSFGSTEIRFKPDKETIGFPEPEKREEEPKKVAHYFASTTEKHTDHTRQDRDKPPPGSYDPDYYDIAKRAQIKESYFSSAKKVPFSTSETRFKELKKENNKTLQPENLMEGDYNFRKNKDAVFLKRETPSSVFNSKTDRVASSMSRKGLPGPGTYSNTQSGWLKKSYNIKFIED